MKLGNKKRIRSFGCLEMSYLIKSHFVLICCIIASCPDSRVYSHRNHRVITIFLIVPLSTWHKAYLSSVSNGNSFSFRVQNGKSWSAHHFLTGQDENTRLNICFGEKREYVKGKIHIIFFQNRPNNSQTGKETNSSYNKYCTNIHYKAVT